MSDRRDAAVRLRRRARPRCSTTAASTTGSRCSPRTATTGCRCSARAQADPHSHNSLAYEDRLLLQLRIERLKNPRAHSQHPPSHCQHVLQRSRVERIDDAAGTATLRTPFLYVEARGEQQLMLAGTLPPRAGAHAERPAHPAEARRPAQCRARAAGHPACSSDAIRFTHPPHQEPRHEELDADPDAQRAGRGRWPPASRSSALAADLKVGLSVSLSGPNSSLGVPYAKGMQAALAYKPEVNGRKIQLDRARRRLRPDHRRAATRASWSRRRRSTC